MRCLTMRPIYVSLVCTMLWLLTATAVPAWAKAGDEVAADAPAKRERVEGASLWPLERGDATFELTGGEREEPEIVQQRTAAVEGRKGAWQVELEGVNTLYVVRTRSGATRLYRLDMPEAGEGGYAAVFLDPVTVLPATLEPGDLPREKSRVQIFNLATGELQHEGTARSEITNVGKATLDTPAGKFDGYLLELDLTLDMDMAQMRLHFDCGLAPGRGIVYRRVRSTLEKLGLFGETTQREAKLTKGK